MIVAAKRTIWISSLTPPSRRLTELLLRKAQEGVRIILIIAQRTLRSLDQAKRLDHLEEAGVDCRCLHSTHSKCLVVDEEYVMVGSANAGGVHRDLCAVWLDPELAHDVIAYLDSLR